MEAWKPIFFEAFWEPEEYSTPDTGESYAELHKVFYSITCFINETKTQILLPLLYVLVTADMSSFTGG